MAAVSDDPLTASGRLLSDAVGWTRPGAALRARVGMATVAERFAAIQGFAATGTSSNG